RIPAPAMVLGARQKPMDGSSLLPSLGKCEPDKPRTQYFEITGKVGLYHDGWFLSGEDGRLSWKVIGPQGPRPQLRWTLYDLRKDFSQSTDLSAKLPERTRDMIALFRKEASANNVFPLDHRFGAARQDPAALAMGRKRHDFWGKNISLPLASGPVLMARSFTLEADLDLSSNSASGVVVALGSRFGGWSLYLDQGRPAFHWARSTDPMEIRQGIASVALPAGKVTLRMRFETGKLGDPAQVVLSSAGSELASLDLPVNFVMPAGNGELLDIGRDLGVPVTDYRTPHGAIEGDISHVRISFD
ncbi:MAG: arylsulfatase, partial [Novosphingobium sp.]|nr:arylsulfatase [Novosphingobium sp.]